MVIIIGFGIHPLSGAWEIELIERFRVCLQACSCYFLHDNPSRIAQSRYKNIMLGRFGWLGTLKIGFFRDLLGVIDWLKSHIAPFGSTDRL
jgi:hypothetical protein